MVVFELNNVNGNEMPEARLTLTLVVFEFRRDRFVFLCFFSLTLTLVVFEFMLKNMMWVKFFCLTLTLVVFEF